MKAESRKGRLPDAELAHYESAPEGWFAISDLAMHLNRHVKWVSQQIEKLEIESKKYITKKKNVTFFYPPEVLTLLRQESQLEKAAKAKRSGHHAAWSPLQSVVFTDVSHETDYVERFLYALQNRAQNLTYIGLLDNGFLKHEIREWVELGLVELSKEGEVTFTALAIILVIRVRLTEQYLMRFSGTINPSNISSDL